MISAIKESVVNLLKEKDIVSKIGDQRYSHMKYPKFLSLMDFYVDRYEIKDFGHLMVMHTKTKMGMELLTMSFMPDGVCLPYLLIDTMSMKKKRCAFVEYYGCGYEGLKEDRLEEVFEQHKKLADYEEKPGWYISERRPYSLIKTGEKMELCDMVYDGVTAYIESIREAKRDEDYNNHLRDFRKRMIEEGNPSSKTLEMLLKKDGAITFMKEIVMPVKEERKSDRS